MESMGGTKRSQDQAAYQTFFSFFGLQENPFKANPDPRYLFLSSSIRRALNELTIGAQIGKSLIVLTGEAGTGKTSLINHLLATLRRQETPVSFVFNSHLDINNLFEFVLTDFGVKFDVRQNPNLRSLLNQWLVQHYVPGRAPVIILDEAQGLSTAVLEEIRMLLNMEIGGESLVRVVLVGQPDLDLKLHKPELRQLRQRIMVRCRTMPLSVEETYGYIQHRLRVAGSPDGAAFSQAAMDAVHFYSAGVPRVVNLICEHSLINAYSDSARPVPPQAVEDVAWEFGFDDFRPLPARSADRTVGELIPMDSTSGSRMRMSALRARELAPIEEPAVEAALVAEFMRPSSLGDTPIPTASVEPVAHRMAAVPEVSLPKATVEASVPAPPAAIPSPVIVSPATSQTSRIPEPAVASPTSSQAPPVRSPVAVSPAPSSAPPVRSPAVAAHAPSQSWNMPRPVANMSWSRKASVKPIALRFRATGALLEASVTRIKHKLDELKTVEKLQHIAESSMHWLRQPMRPAHRAPVGTRQKP
ncbi:MAG TPA: AAA family ATPase [Candidatus Acidoferrales bacterium]|nr:AAA family ATPase [Candidatus Acidoferrales bacterium]